MHAQCRLPCCTDPAHCATHHTACALYSWCTMNTVAGVTRRLYDLQALDNKAKATACSSSRSCVTMSYMNNASKYNR
jgi:hypothetical protein